MSNTMKLRSGATIPQVSREEADKKHYLTRGVLTQMHLMPNGDPAAFDKISKHIVKRVALIISTPPRWLRHRPSNGISPEAEKRAECLTAEP